MCTFCSIYRMVDAATMYLNVIHFLSRLITLRKDKNVITHY